MKHRKHTAVRRAQGAVGWKGMLPFGAMALGYLAGCVLGACFGVSSTVPDAIFSVLTENADGSGSSFLAVFGGYGFYGVLFLILSTTYLGFLLVPIVLAAKGFFTGSVFLAYLRSGATKAFWRAAISLCLPEIFVLPALLLLGGLCMQLSFRLLCRYRGAPASGGERNNRVLAVILILLLLAATVETYAVPPLLRLVSS